MVSLTWQQSWSASLLAQGSWQTPPPTTPEGGPSEKTFFIFVIFTLVYCSNQFEPQQFKKTNSDSHATRISCETPGSSAAKEKRKIRRSKSRHIIVFDTLFSLLFTFLKSHIFLNLCRKSNEYVPLQGAHIIHFLAVRVY